VNEALTSPEITSITSKFSNNYKLSQLNHDACMGLTSVQLIKKATPSAEVAFDNFASVKALEQ